MQLRGRQALMQQHETKPGSIATTGLRKRRMETAKACNWPISRNHEACYTAAGNGEVSEPKEATLPITASRRSVFSSWCGRRFPPLQWRPARGRSNTATPIPHIDSKTALGVGAQPAQVSL